RLRLSRPGPAADLHPRLAGRRMTTRSHTWRLRHPKQLVAIGGLIAVFALGGSGHTSKATVPTHSTGPRRTPWGRIDRRPRLGIDQHSLNDYPDHVRIELGVLGRWIAGHPGRARQHHPPETPRPRPPQTPLAAVR